MTTRTPDQNMQDWVDESELISENERGADKVDEIPAMQRKEKRKRKVKQSNMIRIMTIASKEK